MGFPVRDLTGMRFGKLQVLKRAGSNRFRCALWRCLCDCGKMVDKTGRGLLRGSVKTCGAHYAQGGAWSGERPTYLSWRAMQARCLDTSHKWYKHYGGRGISIYFDWLGEGGFQNFLRDVGKRPYGRTLDRIETDGNYEPGNCRWATPKEQRANQRRKNLRRINP